MDHYGIEVLSQDGDCFDELLQTSKKKKDLNSNGRKILL